MTETQELLEEQLTNPRLHEQTPQKTEMKWIGGALALIHEGIPLTPALQERLFGQVFPEGSVPVLDYVNLATDELLPRTSEDVTAEYYSSFRFPWFAKMRERFSPKMKLRKESIIQNIKDFRERTADQLGSDFLDTRHQDSDFTKNMSKVFERSNSDTLYLFLESIKQHSDKPFLIIDGHGTTKKKKWMIGEHSGELMTPLDIVFEEMDAFSDKYSAILLISCNVDKNKPPRLKESPIFYVDGLAGNSKEARNKVSKVI